MNGPKTLIDFMEMYKTEEDCRQALFHHKWPEGFVCPRCGHGQAYAHKKRLLYECASCGHQTSLTAGTVLHKTRVDLKKWFLAIYLMSQTKKTISAAELSRQLGIAPQTAWTMRRKITEAMARREGDMITGVVEMDESLVGGVSKGKRGRGAAGKTPVAVMAGVSPGGGLIRVHMQALGGVSGLSLEGAAQDHIAPGADIVTDGLLAYRDLPSLGYRHRFEVIGSSRVDAATTLPWVHVTISNFKRWVLDMFHGVSSKHLQSYLDEFCYRLNRRKQRTDLFRRLLNRCVLFTGPVTYAQLVVS